MALRLASRHVGGVETALRPPRKRLYITLLALAVVLILGALCARPIVHWAKRWQALHFVEASAQALHAKDLNTAVEKAEAAMRLWPYDARVLRQRALVINAISPAQATRAWMETWMMSKDLADLRHVIESALAAGDAPLAIAEYNWLRQADPANPLTWYDEALVRMAQNQWPEALMALQRVLDSGKAPEDTHLLFAQASLRSADPVVRAAGLERLRLLSLRSDALGLRALRILPFAPGMPPAEIERVAAQLQAHPLASLQDKLLALTVLSRLPGANQVSLVENVQALFPANDKTALAQTGRWLVQQGTKETNEAALRLIDSQTARQRSDLFQIRLDALAGLGQWAAVENELTQKDPPIPPELRLLFEARALTELHAGVRANVAWDKVRLSLSNQPDKLRSVAAYAINLGLYDYARPVLEQLTKDPEQRYWAYAQLLQLERSEHHTELVYDVLNKMAQLFPNDPPVLNDQLYVGFLLGKAGTTELADAERLRKEYPDMLAYRVTMALGLLRAGQAAAALRQLEDVPATTWPTVVNPMRAVCVAVLRANGRAAEAGALESTINPKALFPEEKALLNTPLPAQ